MGTKIHIQPFSIVALNTEAAIPSNSIPTCNNIYQNPENHKLNNSRGKKIEKLVHFLFFREDKTKHVF